MEQDLDGKRLEVQEGQKPRDRYSITAAGLIFDRPPQALPFGNWKRTEYRYLINLDQEILTIDGGVHFKLDNIPRGNDQWRAAVNYSALTGPTVDLNVCGEEHVGSPALELPEPDWNIGFESLIVTPKTPGVTAHQVLLADLIDSFYGIFLHSIAHLGREWDPCEYAFREFSFGIISIASGRFSLKHSNDTSLPFGGYFHLPGESPGASPPDTRYWFQGVLVSLALVVDGRAISEAAAWGLEQGHTSFQIVVMSLFKVAFAEVSVPKAGGRAFVRASKPLQLSPLRAEDCFSSHPRERPPVDSSTRRRHWQEEKDTCPCKDDMEHPFGYCPGLLALINFFDVAATRKVCATSVGKLPAEICHRILDFVDYETWKDCQLVSASFREYCLKHPKLDDLRTVIRGPFSAPDVSLTWKKRSPAVLFDFRENATGKVERVACGIEPDDGNEGPQQCSTSDNKRWYLEFGDQRKVIVQFPLAFHEIQPSG
ncbi:F-box domain protein [Sarocladium implicatum]|nr:F-box domain protein [Sarocladium implicatum]